MTDQLSHIDENGHARMVDIADKAVTKRRAVAKAYLICLTQTIKTRQGRPDTQGRGHFYGAIGWYYGGQKDI